MLGKLTNDETKKVQAEYQATVDTRAALVTAIEEFNGQVAHLFDTVQGAINAHNEAGEALVETLEGIGSDQRSEYDDKSEKWQEGDRASSINEWIEKFEDAQFEEINIEAPSIPEDEAGDGDFSELDIPSSFEG
jgi:hypothetical protein